MTYARSDFQSRLENRQKQQATHRESEIRTVAQAAVPMELLTGQEHWDFFLSLLQSEVDALDRVLTAMREAHALDPSFAHEDLAAWKAQMMQLAVQKETLEHVASIPREIIEKGEKAKIALRTITDS